jgi:signal transduction histidine kinase
MNLIERAKNIIVTPATEWEVINNETTTTAQLYTGYIMLLAAIGPLAMFIGGGFFSILFRLPMAIVSYVLSLVGVFIIALIIDLLAPNFGGQKNQIQALKLAAYAQTPAWILGILHIVPFLGVLIILGSLYGLYLLYLGLPVLMKVAQEKVIAYTAVIIVCAIVVFAIFGSIVATVSGLALFGAAASMGDHASVNLDAMRQLGTSIDTANKNANTSNPQVPVATSPAAAMNAAAALQGNGQVMEPVDQTLLKAMLPEAIGNMKRNKFEAEKVAMANFKLSKAEAGYSDDQGQSANLTITDAGGAAPFAMLAAWALIEQERETDDGYEKMGKVDGRAVHEKYNKKTRDGEYSVVVANRFLVEAQGHQIDMDTLKQAVTGIGLDKLEALKSSGIKQ